MNFKKMSLKEIHELILLNKIKPSEIIKSSIEESKKQLDSNFLVTLTEKEAIEQSIKLDKEKSRDSFLFGIPYVAKDNISTKNILTTASSKMLSNYIPPFNATIIEKLNNANAVLVGKGALDELGMGGTGLFNYFGKIVNPLDSKRIIGGSSSGSAYAVQQGIVPFSIGTDTGDSIRKPASFVGIVGFKPSYGAISRFGVIPYAPSLDHVGFFTRNVDDMAYVCEQAYGFDKKDFTSQNIEANFKNEKINKPIRFGFIQSVEKYLDENLYKHYEVFFNTVKKDGHKVVNLDFKKELLDAINPTYMIISFSEGVSTSSNLDGIKYGVREDGNDYTEIIRNSRTKGFGDVVKRRFILGQYQLKEENQEDLLLKAKKVRNLIKMELDNLFKQVDILVLPPSLEIAPLISDILGVDVEEKESSDEVFLEDLLIMANFNGMPSITLPFIKKENMPVGINLNAKLFNDVFLLNVSRYVEDTIKKINGGKDE